MFHQSGHFQREARHRSKAASRMVSRLRRRCNRSQRLGFLHSIVQGRCPPGVAEKASDLVEYLNLTDTGDIAKLVQTIDHAVQCLAADHGDEATGTILDKSACKHEGIQLLCG